MATPLSLLQASFPSPSTPGATPQLLTLTSNRQAVVYCSLRPAPAADGSPPAPSIGMGAVYRDTGTVVSTCRSGVGSGRAASSLLAPLLPRPGQSPPLQAVRVAAVSPTAPLPLLWPTTGPFTPSSQARLLPRPRHSSSPSPPPLSARARLSGRSPSATCPSTHQTRRPPQPRAATQTSWLASRPSLLPLRRSSDCSSSTTRGHWQTAGQLWRQRCRIRRAVGASRSQSVATSPSRLSPLPPPLP